MNEWFIRRQFGYLLTVTATFFCQKCEVIFCSREFKMVFISNFLLHFCDSKNFCSRNCSRNWLRYDCQPMLDGLHLETKIYEKSTVINWYTVLWLLEWRFNWIPSFNLVAEAGGFEPPVRLPVRQFSKLVVSATHPNFLLFRSVISQTRCKDKGINWIMQTFCSFFRYIFLMEVIRCW